MKITKTLLTISFFLFKSITCFAQWSTDTTINNPICIAQNDQSPPYTISDGNGGTIMVWYDFRNGASNIDIYAQRIDANGVIQWVTDGIPICTAVNNQEYPQIIPDGNGGAIIAWSDYRNSTFEYDIYAQKINAAGLIQWANNGVPICTAAFDNHDPNMVSDGNGGAIITWVDNRILENNLDIYAQSINSSGIVQWATDGIVICGNTAQNQFPKIVSDGSNGAIITWQDSRNGNFDIYAQRVNSSGIIQWTNNGVAICTAPDSQSYPSIISNNNGGAIITWSDGRNSSTSAYDIFAQCINSNGIVQWAVNGVTICASSNDQDSPELVSDGNNGAIITWTDYRITANSADLYAQRISSNGIVQWAANGIAISNTINNQWLANIISDNNGGAIITWQDERLDFPSYDIYVQRINFNGDLQWTTNGTPVSTAINMQRKPSILSDGNGGSIITWADFRSGTNYDIYAQKINTSGTLSTDMYAVSNDSLYIFPNPSNGLITIKSTENISYIYITNQLGEIVYKNECSNLNDKDFDLTNLSNGIYFYKVITDSNKISKGKIIIKH
ncbi:T9SS type A sorting domain-containing protein [Flavobacterium urocaniciphilum]|uniref:Por secretion system C-terminal sorting domain-containing protein n=1 Tax=Flavobacterium urocaniciphilum TaxID=1299341 RepID=A0A1H8YSS2_9FLAO|nr:T9SS type A sorting domain-containing protein [Flavobacterium urocaniciphilum]SEP55245.1 Por secretion system C-terminal sorting domain-containing protein [Flavobacterium urocaniciphilum]